MSKTDPHLFFGNAFPKALQNLAVSLSRQLEEGHICIDLNDENFLSLQETISAKPDKLCIIDKEDRYKTGEEKL